MLDELFEIFERDNDRGGQRAGAGERRGIRGFFDRLLGRGGAGDDVTPQDPSSPAADPYADRPGDRDGRTGRAARRRDRDRDEGFDSD